MPASPFVFICYAHADRDYVMALADYLDERGVQVWYDRHTPGGQRWDEVLRGRIEECAALVVVTSDRAQTSDWIKRELAWARYLTKPIFPVLLSGQRFPDLRKFQEEDVRGGRLPRREWVADLRRQITAVSAAPELSRSPPAPGTAPRRRWLWLAAAAVVIAVGVGFYLIPRSPAPVSSADPCGGRPTHIDAVSTVTPGHTGYQPRITVTVCHGAPPGHEYWLMDYIVDNGSRVFFVKVQVDGAVASARPYPVVHSPSTDTRVRYYVVIDVPPELALGVHNRHTTDEGQLLPVGAQVPDGMTMASGTQYATL
jgi:hypothetical protein